MGGKKSKKKRADGDIDRGKQGKKAGKAGAKKRAAAVSPLAPAGGFPQLPSIAGVRFNAIEAGVRYADRLDVMLAEIAGGSTLAGVFTRSQTRAAPVLWCEEKLDGLRRRTGARRGFAIVVNSGNANAFTGGAGRAAVEATARAAAEALHVPVDHVFLASTGVIGEPLPVERIVAKLEALRDGLDAGGVALAARAIMTTDTFPKGAAATVELDGTPVTIVGIAKGSGMIAPDMATMLAYVFTDAAVDGAVLQKMLSRANAASFNCISVDGDTSTSDMALIAATGQSGARPIASSRDPRARAFELALTGVMRDLARQIVRDGEGATKFVELRVTGAASNPDARKVGLAVANSPLVKTAIAGEDPNWGRIVMAVGKSGAKVDRDRLAIRFGDIPVAEKGWVSADYSETAGAAYMKSPELAISIDLGLGSGESTIWTCDLTARYIEINADYRS